MFQDRVALWGLSWKGLYEKLEICSVQHGRGPDTPLTSTQLLFFFCQFSASALFDETTDVYIYYTAIDNC
jgi:hypothetical protein